MIEHMEDKREPRSNRTDGTDRTNRTYDPRALIPSHGGYRKLKSYQATEIIYDATVAFCNRFIDRRSRTHDQMVQAARSGKQNIAEASHASATSKKTELKLTGVARASLEELLQDYQDFLRQHHLPLWPKDHPQAQAIRRIAYMSDRSYQSYRSYVEEAPPETAANAVICLIHQANYLLDQQLRSLEQRFLSEGGFTERLYSARRQHRDSQSNPSHRSYGSNESHGPG
jgi:four helix bundle suffix protein